MVRWNRSICILPCWLSWLVLWILVPTSEGGEVFPGTKIFGNQESSGTITFDRIHDSEEEPGSPESTDSAADEDDDMDHAEDEDDLKYDDTSKESLDQPEIEVEKERSHQSEENQGWLPKIYDLFRSGFTSQRSKPEDPDSSKDLNDRDEEDLSEYENSGEDLLEESDADDDVGAERGLLDFSLASAVQTNNTDTEIGQGRQFFPMPMYMLQGIYLIEPRLNPFIDGVLKNLGSEIKVSGIDPLHYRVLPKGRVASRVRPPRRIQQLRRRKPVQRRKQRRPLGLGLGAGRMWTRRKRRGNQRRRAVAEKKGGRQIAGKNVGLGRVDGLSRLIRDGSTEMQSQTADGNYTLVRSHFSMGPLDLTMQFRTVRGIKRAATTIHKIRVHTVTRVSNEGSEMMDFFLDRPHPETIKVRGQLFPMAERVAKNVFSRLFSNDSFLVARIREKTSMALLSKPTSAG